MDRDRGTGTEGQGPEDRERDTEIGEVQTDKDTGTVGQLTDVGKGTEGQ